MRFSAMLTAPVSDRSADSEQSTADSYKDRALLCAPNQTLHDFPSFMRYPRPEDLAIWIQALRKAGMPE